MFKKKILSLILIALIAISSIGACNAGYNDGIRADNHKMVSVFINHWTEWCCDQYDYETGKKIAHIGYTTLNKWYELKPKVSNIYFKQKEVFMAWGIPVPRTICELNLKNYQYDPLYIHSTEDANGKYNFYIEYHGFKTKTYKEPKDVTIDLYKLELGQLMTN